MQMMFRTAYDGDSEVFFSDPGSKFLDEYEYQVDKAGVKKLVKTDRQTDVFARIQADYPSTDINLLMKKFALGDTNAINIKEGMYFDATQMPTNYADLFNRVEQARQYFDTLPPELKEMFNNSYEQFFTEFETKSFNDKIDKYNDQFVNHQFDIKEDAPTGDPGKEIEY